MNMTKPTALDDLLLYVLSFTEIDNTFNDTSEYIPEILDIPEAELLIQEWTCMFNCSYTLLEAQQELEDTYTEHPNTQFKIKKKRHTKQKVPDNIKQTEKYKIRRQKNTKCAQITRYENRKQKQEDINELIELKKINADLHIERDNLIKIIKNQEFTNFIHNHTTYNVMCSMDVMDIIIN